MYNEILDIYRDRIDDFFKNVPTFENQLTYDDFNDECFDKMYKENNIEDPKKVKELKEEIPQLKDMCKKCGAYFMNPRNKSHVKYDVIMGQFFENILIDYFTDHLKIKATHGDKSNKKYPDCMILGKDKGILAYFEVKYHCAPFISAIQKINRYCYEGSATLDKAKIERQLEIIESDIERPVFYIHWIDYPCVKGIFFETSEQVKETLINEKVFERQEREGDLEKNPQSVYKEKIYSKFLEMGSLEELVSIIKDMQKNGVNMN
ncbi:MAG: hypothetical protein Q4E39_04340 [bacterium]|mgnify:FL=1|nr:hypothetical protein [bacterium]